MRVSVQFIWTANEFPAGVTQHASPCGVRKAIESSGILFHREGMA